MHICLPDTGEVRPAHGPSYLLYNVHIDGLYHCSLRYKQLLHLHQALTKRLNSSSAYSSTNTSYHQPTLPQFPPKKLLPLSANQIEERRLQLEKYLQTISQDKEVSNSSIFNLFLLEAQRESTKIIQNQVHLDIELVNGQKIRLPIVTHNSTDAVLTAVCRALGLKDRFHAYFCLCLCGYDVIRDKLIIKRRLSFFESPYITLQQAVQQQEQLQNVLDPVNRGSNVDQHTCGCQSFIDPGQQLSRSHQNRLHDNNDVSSESVLVSQDQTSYDSGLEEISNCPHNGGCNIGSSCCRDSQYPRCNGQPSNYRLTRLTQAATNSSFVTHRILLRKSYWDPVYDHYLINDQQALNLLFIQTVYDMKHSLMFLDRETYQQLESLLASDSKLEYILLARTLKYYNYVHFEPCFSDYPRPGTRVMISIGSKELNMRVLKTPKTPLPTTQSTSTMVNQVTPTLHMDQAPTTSTPISSATLTHIHDSKQSQSSSAPSSQHQVAPNLSSPDLPQVSNRSSSENVLYCSPSFVPSSYRHLITKNDIVEEEYSFKVPLIRCWRLTSLETLNSNDSRQSSTMACARGGLANGRRKTLSLLSSVIGVSSDNRSQESNGNSIQRNVLCSGIGGSSLVTALAGGRTYNLCRNNARATCHHHNQSTTGSLDPVTSAQQNNSNNFPHQHFCQYELSFEYLVSRYSLKWITISSDQAIFISISLQGVVDELVSKRDGHQMLYTLTDISSGDANNTEITNRPTNGDINNNIGHSGATQMPFRLLHETIMPQVNNKRDDQVFSYMNRDGGLRLLDTNNQKLIDKFGTSLGYSPTTPYTIAMARHRQQAIRASAYSHSLVGCPSSSSRLYHPNSRQTALEICSFKKAPSPIINDAFEGVTNDEDL